jgi:UPF0755 protein
MSRTGKIVAISASLLIVVTLAAFVLGVGWLMAFYPDERGNGTGRVVEFDVSPGISARTLGQRLYEKGLVKDPMIFALYVRVIGADRKLRAGRIRLQDSMSVRQVLQRVAKGIGFAQMRITIPEGYTRFDIADTLELWGLCDRKAFLKATEEPSLLKEFNIDAPSAEGYLFPDTYQLQDGLVEQEIVTRLISNFHRRVGALLTQYPEAVAKLKNEMGWGLRDVVTLASIVEKEAADRLEQPIIAGVFLNRLRRPEFPLRRLQADPTVAYGCRLASEASPPSPGYNGKVSVQASNESAAVVAKQQYSCDWLHGKQITRAMTQDADNPYNTYKLEGLPPGPISNPGLNAIRAVLNPAQHNYFYFVVGASGKHRFSETIDDHNRAVKQYRKIESRR